MRLSSATLLLGSTSVLSALLVSAAPVLVRIKLIENVQLTRKPDDFFRFVRIGAAGASANGHSDEAGRVNAAIGILSNLDTNARIVKLAGGAMPPPVPMRPELEFLSDEMGFDPAQGQEAPQGITGCHQYPNLWEKVFGTINDFIMDFFGRSAGPEKVLCTLPLQDPQHYSALSTFSPNSLDDDICVNGHSDEAGRVNAAIGILSNLDTNARIVELAGGAMPPPVPMRPELEFLSDNEMGFDPAQGQEASQGITGCHQYPNLWEKVFGTINDFIMDFFGRSAGPEKVLCTLPLQDPQHYSALPTFSPNSPDGDISYHRNGSPITSTGSPPFRPILWGYRRRPTTFGRRVQRALYALSPWEGRAVAFVMGCGLGVLIRMLFVFAVLVARVIMGSSRASEAETDEEKEDGMIVVLGDEDVEGVVLFDAGSLKGASVEDLPLYDEKQ